MPYNSEEYLIIFVIPLFLTTPQLSAFQQKGENTGDSAPHPLYGPVSYHNLTNGEVADVLRSRGFKVQEFLGEPPLVRIGDVAFYPEQVMSELVEGRYTAISGKKLWIEEGVAKSWYFFDTESEADRKVFRDAVKTWSDTTCIQFVKLPDAPCRTTRLSHGAVCVGNYSGCWSFVGNVYRPGDRPQKMSVQPNGCELVAAAHEFGHALGTFHQQSKPDRDTYMVVNNEHFKVPLDPSRRAKEVSHTWAQGARCAKDQVVDLPVPFDYMSLMQYSSSAFADNDQRPVFVTKDAHFQYILDYHRYAGLVQSFYDQYAFNTVYGCAKMWTESCGKSGKHPPKCRNFGFVGKNCKCLCPPAFRGHACDKQISSSLFPLAKKAHMVDVTTNKLVDFSMYQMSIDKGDGVLDGFKYYNYFTIIVHGPDESQKVNMENAQPVHLPNDYTYSPMQDFLIQYLAVVDCHQGVMALWGISELGHHRRECATTMSSNEPIGPMFRSKTNHLDFIYYTCIGTILGSPRLSVKLMQFKMQVTFEPSPAKHLLTEQSAPERGKQNVSRPNSTEKTTNSLGAEKIADQRAIWIGIGIAIGILLVLWAVVVWVFCYTRSQSATPAAGADGDMPDDHAGHGEHSDVSSPEWNSDDDYAH